MQATSQRAMGVHPPAERLQLGAVGRAVEQAQIGAIHAPGVRHQAGLNLEPEPLVRNRTQTERCSHAVYHAPRLELERREAMPDAFERVQQVVAQIEVLDVLFEEIGAGGLFP